jgi:hypothetical protein
MAVKMAACVMELGLKLWSSTSYQKGSAYRNRLTGTLALTHGMPQS